LILTHEKRFFYERIMNIGSTGSATFRPKPFCEAVCAASRAAAMVSPAPGRRRAAGCTRLRRSGGSARRRRDDAMRREALDRERPGDAHAARIGVGLVVEILDIGRT